MSQQRVVKKSVFQSPLAVNNNQMNAFASLKKAQKENLKRHLSDLAWQIKFSDPSRSKWQNVDSNSWIAIIALHERAKKELRLLLDQEKGRVKKIKKAL